MYIYIFPLLGKYLRMRGSSVKAINGWALFLTNRKFTYFLAISGFRRPPCDFYQQKRFCKFSKLGECLRFFWWRYQALQVLRTSPWSPAISLSKEENVLSWMAIAFKAFDIEYWHNKNSSLSMGKLAEKSQSTDLGLCKVFAWVRQETQCAMQTL